MDLPAGFVLAAVLEREDARDAWCLEPLRRARRSCRRARWSARRACAASSSSRALRPDLRLEPLRGNLDTRLRKLDEGGYDAIVLAAAGLVRLGLAARIRACFAATQMLPCAGQGALAIEARADAAALIARARRADASRRRGSPSPPSERSRARSAAAAACRSPRTPPGAATRSSSTRAVGHPDAANGAAAARAIAGAVGRRAAPPRRSAVARRARCWRPARRPISPPRERLGAGADRAVTRRGRARVLVTRPAAQAEAWVEPAARARHRRRGAAADRDRARPADASALRSSWAGLAACRLVVFVSANAVLHFFAERPRRARLARTASIAARARPRHRRCAARGRRAGRLRSSRRRPTRRSSTPSRSGRACTARDWRGARVLVVRGDGGRDWLAERLRRRRARRSTRVSGLPAPGAGLRAAQRASGSMPRSPTATRVWLFSSSEAIANLERAAGTGPLGDARAVATHPRIAARARGSASARVVEAAPGLDAVIACLQSIQP